MEDVKAQLTPIGQTYNGVTIFENPEGMLGTYLEFLNCERASDSSTVKRDVLFWANKITSDLRGEIGDGMFCRIHLSDLLSLKAALADEEKTNDQRTNNNNTI